METLASQGVIGEGNTESRGWRAGGHKCAGYTRRSAELKVHDENRKEICKVNSEPTTEGLAESGFISQAF